MSSAGAVYGRIKTPFKETQLPKPANNYGKAKLAVEKILKQQADDNFKATVIRATNVIGLGQKFRHNQGVIPAIINCLKQDKVFTLWGNSQKDYLAVDDLISALMAVAKQKTAFEVFNVGSGTVLSVTDIIKIIEAAANKKLKLKQTPAKNHDLSRVEVDRQKIQQHLNWQPRQNIYNLINQIVKL
jgi:nucleoside-diphosphate-sugar epimerase